MNADRSIRAGTGVFVFGFALVAAFAAYADCNTDVAALTQKRQAVINELNATAKGKQLDPVTSCPKLRGLVVAEHALYDYLSKNKDWCQVPDAAVENISLSMKKSQGYATQACGAAAQMKKMQAQQAAGINIGAPARALPTGPL